MSEANVHADLGIGRHRIDLCKVYANEGGHFSHPTIFCEWMQRGPTLSGRNSLYTLCGGPYSLYRHPTFDGGSYSPPLHPTFGTLTLTDTPLLMEGGYSPPLYTPLLGLLLLPTPTHGNPCQPKSRPWGGLGGAGRCTRRVLDSILHCKPPIYTRCAPAATPRPSQARSEERGARSEERGARSGERGAGSEEARGGVGVARGV